MPYLPTVPSGNDAKPQFVEVFGGYRHTERNSDGTKVNRKSTTMQWYDEKNLSARHYPVMATRRARAEEERVPTAFCCAVTARDKLWTLQLHYGRPSSSVELKCRVILSDGEGAAFLPDTYSAYSALASSERQIIGMGSYLLIWPDKVWVNTATVGAYPYISHYDNTIGEKSIKLYDQFFQNEITTIRFVTTEDVPPENPSNGDYWLYQKDSKSQPVLRKWYQGYSSAYWQYPITHICFSGFQISDVEAGDFIRFYGVSTDTSEMYSGDYGFLNNGIWLVSKVDETGLYVEGACLPGEYSYYQWGFSVKKRTMTVTMGDMEQNFANTGTAAVVLCKEDGTAYGTYTTSDTAPESPDNKDLWMDTGGDKPALKEYSAEQSKWITIANTYVKISATAINDGFAAGDGVFITGLSDAALNGNFVIQAVGTGWIAVQGILTAALSDQSVTVARTVPDMDYVTECNNRIWGCKYGVVNGDLVNEIYASKLGDFKNWNCFQGLSTDSYAASRGSPGPWTGAVTYGGQPLFFKEDYIEKVYPSASGAHQIVSVQARGVQDGSSRSLAVLNEALYYKGVEGVMVYDGSLPHMISDDLGEIAYSRAAAAGLDGVYYISMADTEAQETQNWRLFTFDVEKGVWHREEDTHATYFAAWEGKLYWAENKVSLAADGDRLYPRYSAPAYGILVCDRGGTEDVDWMAESGPIGYHDFGQKYLSRFVIRAETEGYIRLYLKYDNGPWQAKGAYTGAGVRSFVLPVPPRRCDHVKIKLEGNKSVNVYGITRYYEQGSDQAW